MECDEGAAPVHQHAVVVQVVLQVPDVRVRRRIPDQGRERGVVACVRVNHRDHPVFNAVIRCIFRALHRSARRVFLHIQLLPVRAVHVVRRAALLAIDIMWGVKVDGLLKRLGMRLSNHLDKSGHRNASSPDERLASFPTPEDVYHNLAAI